MNKIPIGRTIGASFDFAFGRYFSIWGIIWLPLLILLAGEYFVFVPYFRHLIGFVQFAAQHPHKPPVPLPPELRSTNPIIMSFDFAALLISIWIQVGIAKAALGLRRGPSFVYVPLGLDEVRLVGAYFVVLAIFAGAAIAAVLVGAIVGGIGYAVAAGGAFDLAGLKWLAPWGIGALFLAGFAVVCALIYVQVRLTYLLVPVTVAERRFGLWHSWTLSKGNFWRIFVVGVGTLSPILVFEMALVFGFYFFVLISIIGQLAHALAHQHGAAHDGAAVASGMLVGFFRGLIVYVVVVLAVWLPFVPIAMGLRLSSSAFAYRALTEKAG